MGGCVRDTSWMPEKKPTAEDVETIRRIREFLATPPAFRHFKHRRKVVAAYVAMVRGSTHREIVSHLAAVDWEGERYTVAQVEGMVTPVLKTP